MKNFDFEQLFDNIAQSFGDRIYSAHAPRTSAVAKKRKRSRTCRIEELESREMLDAATFAAIQALHPDLNLGEYEEYNYIEIQVTGNRADDNTALRGAITTAGTTELNDIIVVRTTATNNTIVSSQDSLVIDVAAEFGDVVIVGYGDTDLTLDGGNEKRVFDITAGTTVGLAGLTITKGYEEFNRDNGGGIRNAGTLTITNSTITDNVADGSGGAIYNTGIVTMTHSEVFQSLARDVGGIYNSGTMTIEYSTIRDSSATTTGGGVFSSGTLTILGSQIRDNEAGTGGGIYSSGRLIIDDSTVSGNSATGNGGGIYSGGNSTIVGTTISGNTATEDGGGIIFENISNGLTIQIDIENCAVTDNSSGGVGGGIYYLARNTSISTTTTNAAISNSLITGNESARGGGIGIRGERTGNGSAVVNVTVSQSDILGNSSTGNGGGIEATVGANGGIANINTVNSVLAGNEAGGDGGGIFYGANGTLFVSSSTIAGNSAAAGGGLRLTTGSWVLYNTLIAGNTTGGDLRVDYSDSTPGLDRQARYNLIGNGDEQDFINDGASGNIAGTTANPIDPLFASFEGINWAAWDLRLLNGSPAIDEGSNEFALDGVGGNQLTVDRNGDVRIFNATGTAEATIDIGAYENDGTVIVQPPEVPLNLRSPNQTETTIDLEWDTAARATRYDIQWRMSGDANWTLVAGITDLFTVIGNLLPGTLYEFQVRGVNDSDVSAWSAILPVSTAGDVTVPVYPQNFRATATTLTSISLGWNPAAGATGYEIRYRVEGENAWTGLHPVGAVTATTIEDLLEDTTYEFQIRTLAGTEVSEWSPTVTATTGTEIIDNQPDTPTGLRTTLQTTETITLQWNAQSDATNFMIQYRAEGTTDWTTHHSRPAGTTAVLGGLTAGTVYEIRICALDGNTPSEWSDSIRVSTYPAAPQNFRSTAQTTNSITLSWNAQRGVLAYTLQYRVEGTTAWTTTAVAPSANATRATVSGLTANTSYEFRLTARNVSGETSGTTQAATTGAGTNKNNNPIKPKVSKASTLSTVTLTWQHQAVNTEYVVTGTGISQEQVNTTVSNGVYTAVISGLKAGTSYKFSVTASNAEGKTAVTNVSAKTVKYAAPKGVKMVKNSATINSAVLSMPTNVLPETDRYEIRVFAPKSKTASATIELRFVNGVLVGQPTVLSGTVSARLNGNGQLVLGGLLANTKYSLQVQAFAGTVPSGIAKTSVKTLKYAAVKINRVDCSVAVPTVSWSLPKNANVADYQEFVVEVYLASDKKRNHNLIDTTVSTGRFGGAVTGLSTTILGLELGVKYTILVKAVSADGINQSLPAQTSVKLQS